MALSQRLEFRQSQALVMTPQLMQAIKLLQLSNLDLASYVEGELERNPLLQSAAENEDDTSRPAEVEGAGAAAGDEPDERAQPASAEPPPADFDDGSDGGADPDHRRAAGDVPAGYSEWAGMGGGGTNADYNLESFVCAEKTLVDHLAEQLVLAVSDAKR